MSNKYVLDFRAQAEQMMRIIEARQKTGQRQAAVEFLILKFKALYEQGVASGRLYEKEGIFPYTPFQENRDWQNIHSLYRHLVSGLIFCYSDNSSKPIININE